MVSFFLEFTYRSKMDEIETRALRDVLSGTAWTKSGELNYDRSRNGIAEFEFVLYGLPQAFAWVFFFVLALMGALVAGGIFQASAPGIIAGALVGGALGIAVGSAAKKRNRTTVRCDGEKLFSTGAWRNLSASPSGRESVEVHRIRDFFVKNERVRSTRPNGHSRSQSVRRLCARIDGENGEFDWVLAPSLFHPLVGQELVKTLSAAFGVAERQRSEEE